MKPLLSFIWVFMGISCAAAYDEKNMADLAVPTQIPLHSLEISIVHRFYRVPSADFPDNFITMANPKIDLRYVILPGLEAAAGYQFAPKEYTFHAAYSYFFPKLFLRTQALVQFFGTQVFAFNDSGDYTPSWKNNAVYQFNVQSDPLIGRILPTADFVYDGLSSKFGLGAGIDIVVAENMDIVGEYFPVLGSRDSTSFSGPAVNCYSVGFKITTPGHHFMVTVSNSTDLGVRRLMRGTVNNNIYFGFNIQRLISF